MWINLFKLSNQNYKLQKEVSYTGGDWKKKREWVMNVDLDKATIGRYWVKLRWICVCFRVHL